LIQT